MEWMKLLALIGAGFLIWFMFRAIKSNPQLYSRENISKSFSTMGILGLILIAFIAFCIFLLRSSS